MASYENSTIYTSDVEVRKALLEKYSDEQYYFPNFKDNKLYIRNRQGNTHKELLELSTHFDTKIIAEYSFESNRYALTYEVMIKNGECELTDVRVNYYFDYSREFKLYVELETQERIFKELIEFYKTVDSITIYETGEYNYDLHLDKEITIRFKVDSYEIKALKKGNYINIINFKYCEE